MPSFSGKSQDKLNTCHERLVELFSEVIKEYDCSILEGHRTPERQSQLVSEGKSKTMNSNHLSVPSNAVDVAPYPVPEKWGEGNPKEMAEFYYFAGYVKGIADMLGIGIRWGGDWDGDKEFTDQTFDDLVHWELGE